MKPTVFIHIDGKQMVGVIVSARSLKRNSRDPEAFGVKITMQEDFSFSKGFEDRRFLRAGSWRA